MTTTTPQTPDNDPQPGADGRRRFLVTQTEQYVIWAHDEHDACERLLEMDADESAFAYHGTTARTAVWVTSALEPERP